jgi:cobalt-zinc-cadmium efflux system protein
LLDQWLMNEHLESMMSHEHQHSAPSEMPSRAFAIGVALNTAFVVIEAAVGWVSGSLALLADAGHNLSDVATLMIAWGAAYLSQRPPTSRRTYGWGRLSILAALINAVLLLVAVGAIALEALQRVQSGSAVPHGGTVMAVAAIGILVNGATTLLFARGRHGDLNIMAAFQHMAADTAVSVGVVVSGALILMSGKAWIDPAVSLMIAALIAWSSWSLLRSSMHLAVDGVPDQIDEQAVEAYLRSIPGVTDCHDLHIWPLSTTRVALTVHLVKQDATIDDILTQEIAEGLQSRFQIAHATIQFEHGNGPVCALKRANVV